MSTISEPSSAKNAASPKPKPPIKYAPAKPLPPMKRYPAPPEKVTPQKSPDPPSTLVIPPRKPYVPGVNASAVQAKRPSSLESPPGSFFQTTQTFFGFGDREYAFGMVPRGYGITVMAIAGCYSLLRWERNRIRRTKKKPSFTSTNDWFNKLKTIEKAYGQARNDFPRTVMLTLIGGLGMPYAAAVGALFWCAGRAVDFHEAEEKPKAGVENTEAVLCRFGKFLMICGICKFAFDFTRGRINCIINE